MERTEYMFNLGVFSFIPESLCELPPDKLFVELGVSLKKSGRFGCEFYDSVKKVTVRDGALAKFQTRSFKHLSAIACGKTCVPVDDPELFKGFSCAYVSDFSMKEKGKKFLVLKSRKEENVFKNTLAVIFRFLKSEYRTSAFRSQKKMMDIRVKLQKIFLEEIRNPKLMGKKMLETAGPALGLGRACLNRIVNTKGKAACVKCVSEWCAEGVVSSLGSEIPSYFMKIFISDDVKIVDPESLVEEIPAPFRKDAAKLLKPMVENFDLKKVITIPFYRGGEKGGILTFDICSCSEYKPSEESFTIFREISDYLTFSFESGLEKENREELEKKLRLSEKMNAVGEMAGGIAHDFNNLLAIISGYGELVAKKLEDRELKYYMKVLLEAAGSSSDLTEQLLAFSSRDTVKMEKIDMEKVLNDTSGFLKHFTGSSIKFVKDFKCRGAYIKGNHARIQNALLNIGINSRDAMSSGGEIYLGADIVYIDGGIKGFPPENVESGYYVEILMRDTGEGMEEVRLDDIFKPFFSTKKKGNGLGLPAVYGTVKQHKGFLDVRTKKGKGTSFFIYLPLVKSYSGNLVSDPVSMPVSGGLEVAVVDNDPVITGMISGFLSSCGHKPLVFNTADEALKNMVAEKPGALPAIYIIDREMPGMSGEDLFISLMKIDREAKVIFISGESEEEIAKGILQKGKRIFMRKPFSLRKMAENIMRLASSGNKNSQNS
ncbi:MAG: ATP-binding protein [Fibrobacterota bacterium]